MSEYEELVQRLGVKLKPVDSTQPGVPNGAGQAAVALVLRENRGFAEILIIKRAVRSGDHWSGNLALPGGKREAQDGTLLATAIRETFEEVGIDLNLDGRVLGELTPITTRNPMIPIVYVAPFAIVAPSSYHITAAEVSPKGLVLSDEVETAFWSPVSSLVSRGRSETVSMIFKGEQRFWPAYPTDHGVIWGMTETMISEFLSLIA